MKTSLKCPNCQVQTDRIDLYGKKYTVKYETTMKRAYIKEWDKITKKRKWITIGWGCPNCHYFIPDKTYKNENVEKSQNDENWLNKFSTL